MMECSGVAIPMRLAELEKGEVLGEMALFDDRSRTNSSAIFTMCAQTSKSD